MKLKKYFNIIHMYKLIMYLYSKKSVKPILAQAKNYIKFNKK